MKLHEIAYACSVYRILGYDKAYDDLIKNTKPSLDMSNAEHRKVLINWLRNWGCRQFREDYTEQASENLESWYLENKNLLPPLTSNILTLIPSELQNTKIAYNKLTQKKASMSKTVGPTGASKIMFALREEIYPPWDIAMRTEWKYKKGTAQEYTEFLLTTKNNLIQIEKECLKHGFALKQLPNELGIGHYSLIKILDECNIVYITKKTKKLDFETIEEWYNWAKSSANLANEGT